MASSRVIFWPLLPATVTQQRPEEVTFTSPSKDKQLLLPLTQTDTSKVANMPYVKGSVVKTTELSWDAFPEPTPEAESWQPDPDSVPVAGGLPDPRFNKHPLTERQKMALKRERRLELATDGLTTSPGVSSPTASTSKTTTSTGVGTWPVPAPRATGFPRALAVNNDAQHPIFAPPEATKPVEEDFAASTIAPVPSRVTIAAPRFADSRKGTMETLPIQPPFRRPHTPAASITSQEPEPPTQALTPAWARSLAYLLDESPPKPAPLSRPLPVKEHSATPPSTSIPPHLRKQRLATKRESANATLVSKPVNVTIEEQFTHPCNGGPMHHLANGEVESTKLIEGLKLQESLLESFITKKQASSSREHQRYLNTKLISLMEDEMDMEKRTTRRELHSMSDEGLDDHLAKTMSAHKLFWDDEQRTYKKGETDPKTVLADFQQQEQRQFKQIKATPKTLFGAG